MTRLLTEEIAAFYDPKTKAIHTIKEDGTIKRPEPGLLERLLLGKRGGFDKDENKTVLAHELTHALADQNYDLLTLQRKIKGDDDRDLAFSALVEGEATLTMIAAQAEDWDGKDTIKIPAKRMESMIGLLTPMMTKAGGATLREAPPILTETLIFPYMRGLVFCMGLANDGGWEAIDAAYKEPPLSTEQILHFEKYRGPKRDEPTLMELGKLDAGDGWKEVSRNVLGEFQIAVMLRGQSTATTAAAGWDGDRFAAFEGPDNRLGLVWASTWSPDKTPRNSSPPTAVPNLQARQRQGQGRAQSRRCRGLLRRKNGEAVFAIERKGADVAIVEGFSAETTERLVQAAFRRKNPPRPKRRPPRRFAPRRNERKKRSKHNDASFFTKISRSVNEFGFCLDFAAPSRNNGQVSTKDCGGDGVQSTTTADRGRRFVLKHVART